MIKLSDFEKKKKKEEAGMIKLSDYERENNFSNEMIKLKDFERQNNITSNVLEEKKQEEKKDNIKQNKVEDDNSERITQLSNEIKKLSSIMNPTENERKKLEQYASELKELTNINTSPKLTLVSNEKLTGAKDVRELQSELKAEEEAKEINKAVENKDYSKLAGYYLNNFSGSVIGGFGQIGEAATNVGAGIVEGVSNILPEGELKEKTQDLKNDLLEETKRIDTQANYRNKVVNNIDNGVIKLSGQVENTVGNMAASIISEQIFPGSGIFVSAAQEAGSSSTENLDYKNSNLGESLVTGAGKGAIAGLSEKIVGGDFISEGAMDKLAAKGISKLTANKVAQNVLYKIYQNVGEQAEEILEDEVGDLIDAIINKQDIPSLKEKLSRAGETAKVTALSTIVLNALGLGGGNIDETLYDGRTKNEQKLYESLVEQETKSLKTEKAVKQMIEEQTETFKRIYGRELTEEEINEITDKINKVKENGKLDLDNTELSKQEIKDIETEIKKDLEDGNIDVNTIVDILGEDIDTDNDPLIQKSMYEYAQKYSNYQAELTGNEKVDRMLQSAVDSGLNNTSKTRKMIEIVSKLTENTDRQYRFVSQEQLEEMGYNESANGLTDKKTGEILLSVNSNKQIEAVIGHETTHLFDSKVNGEYTQEYKDLQKSVIDFLKTNGTYETKIKEIMDTYTNAGINLNQEQLMEELTADTIGDNLFGENAEEFVKQLTTNRNVFQKLYDYIKKAVRNLRGYDTEEARALQNLKDTFDKVYKTLGTETDNDTDIKYSIQQNEQGQKYVKVDTDQNIFEGIDKKDYNKIAKMYIHDYLIGKTQLSENDTAIIDRKSANKYTNPGKKQQNFDKKMQLTPELKNVLEIAQIDKKSEPSKTNSKYKSWEYYKFNFELSNKLFEGTINIGIDSKGNKHFYEINKIKEINDISETSLNHSNISTNNSIPSSSEEVNTTVKYSIQNNENNAQDNQGRSLSKGQQEYFKDSRIRDDKGHLLEVYHGTNSDDFTIFDKSYIGTANDKGWYGDGFYFATHKGEAKYYGNNVISAYLDIKNPFEFGKLRYLNGEKIDTVNAETYATLKNLINEFPELAKEEMFLGYDNNQHKGIFITYKQYVDEITKLAEKVERIEVYDSDEDFTYWYRIDGRDVLRNQQEDSYENKLITAISWWREHNDHLIYPTMHMPETYIQYIEGGFQKILINHGYDGVIQENTAYDSDEIVAFYPEQIKNVDNKTPTENPDIRYSMTEDNTDRYWKKLNLEDEIGRYNKRNRTNNEINIEEGSNQSSFNLDEDVGSYRTENNTNEITEQQPRGMKDKARKYISRSKTNFINNIVDSFGTSRIANTNTLNDVTERIKQAIFENGKLTKEQKDSYFNELYDGLKKIDTDFYDTYKDLKNDIRNTRLYVSDNVRGDITDFDNFRKSNIRNIIMTNDRNNIPVDTYYKELSDLYPELFPSDIVIPSEQLMRIADVSKDIAKVETNVAAYNDEHLGKDYRNWARETFDRDIDKFIKDIKLAQRYNEEVPQDNTIGMTKALVKEAYSNLPEARRKYEKANSKEVLTREDRIQVDRLLNNEISIQNIPDGLNKEGIIRLATAKSEYDTLQKSISEYQLKIRQNRIEEAKADIGNLDLWKDKNIGFKYSRETPIRNIYDVAPKSIADTILDKYFRPYIETNEKKVIEETNRYFDRVRALNLSDKKEYKVTIDNGEERVSESSLVQLLGEKKITTEQIKEVGADVKKIENAVKEFRAMYNEMFENINESMLDNGYAPVEFRKDYFPHFTEQEPDSILGKAAKLIGIDITERTELPTDISGQTYKFRPGRTWFGNLLQRTTDVTNYDAKKGFEKYVKGAMDLIYHTGDIQNQRALYSAITTAYNDAEIQNQVTDIKENNNFTDLEKAVEIQKIYDTAKDRSHLSKFAEWLNNYTNLLAGKKSINDRGAEKELNRKVYQTMTDIESRIAANAIGGNVGVSLTNFAPLAQAMGEVKTHNLINGMWQTMKASLKHDNSFASESQFITRRRGIDTLTKSTLEKITKPINSVLEFADNFTSEAIVRAKYIQNLQEGMNAEQALEEADRYTAGLMSDRGRGALPTQFSNKNPIAKMINMFQVEVNNQWSYYIKDLPRNLQAKANNNKGSITTDLAMSYTKIMVGSYLINELLGRIRGNSTRVLPDPIYIMKELINGLSDDDDDNDDDAIIQAFTEVAGNVPFIALPATLLADSLGLDVGEIGRIPISGAVPNITDILSALMDNNKTTGEKAKNIAQELADTIGASLILPYGGSQLKKTVKGMSLYNNEIPGSYTEKGDLRYTVDEDLGSKVQAGLFGAWANPYAQDYIDSGYKTISAKNIDEMVGLEMNSTEYRNFKSELNKVGKTTDKNGYKEYTNADNETFWYDSDNEVMYDDNYKETNLTADDLIKVSKTEEKLNYINASDLTDAQKDLVANNLNSNSKKTIDMTEYRNYDSYDEYKYARDYPEQYSVISQITNYNEYMKYKNEIEDLKEMYSTENGYNSKQRKNAIQEYIQNLDLNVYQKIMLEHMAGGYSIKNYASNIQEYLDSTDLDQQTKYYIWKELFE